MVLRSPQQRCYGIIGLDVDDIAGAGDEVWEQAITKFENVSLSHTGKWERENAAVERSCKHLMDPCASDNQPTSRGWTLCLSENFRKEQSGERPRQKNDMRSVLGAVGHSARESQPNLSGPVSILKVVSTELRCQTSKKQFVWSDWLRHTQISHCLASVHAHLFCKGILF